MSGQAEAGGSQLGLGLLKTPTSGRGESIKPCRVSLAGPASSLPGIHRSFSKFPMNTSFPSFSFNLFNRRPPTVTAASGSCEVEQLPITGPKQEPHPPPKKASSLDRMSDFSKDKPCAWASRERPQNPRNDGSLQTGL